MNDGDPNIRTCWSSTRGLGYSFDVRDLPNMIGPTQVAKIVGVRQSNLAKVVGLPLPIPVPPAPAVGGRLWLEDEVRHFAKARNRRIKAQERARTRTKAPKGRVRSAS